MATVTAVDPRRLPVPVRRSNRRAFISVGHIWILHKRLFVRGIAAFICCAVIVLIYEARDHISDGVGMLTGMLQGEFTDAGFAINQIEITGQTITPDRDIVTALGLEPKLSTLNFDAEAARARVAELPAIASATVRKVYPEKVVVTVNEKVPVARWKVDGVTFVVDAQGEQIGEDKGAYGELPLVVGDGAADDALSMIRALNQYTDLKEGLVALSRIGDRRWDLIYDTGLRVELPEIGVAQALVQLDGFQRDHALLDRDITIIDLRVPGQVALKPAVREETADPKKPTTTGTPKP